MDSIPVHSMLILLTPQALLTSGQQGFTRRRSDSACLRDMRSKVNLISCYFHLPLSTAQGYPRSIREQSMIREKKRQQALPASSISYLNPYYRLLNSIFGNFCYLTSFGTLRFPHRQLMLNVFFPL